MYLHSNAIALPAARTTDEARAMARQFSQNPAALMSFASDLVEARQHEGWTFESHPGQRLVLTNPSATSFRDVYATPPAEAGIDVAFRITRLNSGNGAFRLGVAAYDRRFTNVRARRTFSITDTVFAPPPRSLLGKRS